MEKYIILAFFLLTTQRCFYSEHLYIEKDPEEIKVLSKYENPFQINLFYFNATNYSEYYLSRTNSSHYYNQINQNDSNIIKREFLDSFVKETTYRLKLDQPQIDYIIIYYSTMNNFTIKNSSFQTNCKALGPYRFEATRFDTFIISILILLGILLLLFLFRNYEPLASRSIAPYLAVIVNIIDITLNYIMQTTDKCGKKWCYLWMFSFCEFSVIIGVFNYIRYSFVIHIDKTKVKAIQKNSRSKILKCLHGSITNILFFLFIIIISVIISLILLIRGDCLMDTVYNMITTKVFIFFIIILSIMIIIFVYNLFQNYFSKQKFLNGLIFPSNDPFHFHLEFYLLFIPLILMIIFLIQHMVDRNILSCYLGRTINNIIWSVLLLLFMIVDLFSLFLTILFILIKKIYQPIQNIEQIYSNVNNFNKV